jgi:hypothetical protein
VSPETGQSLGAAALALVILREVFNFLGPILRNGKAKNGNGNGTSGEKPPDYWLRAFEEIVEKVMNRRNAVLEKMMREEIEKAMAHKFKARGM